MSETDNTTESNKANESNTEEVDKDDHNTSHDPYFPPIITLPEVVVDTGEKDEEELLNLRAKLYRYAHECDPPEWKDRGTGDAKILKHSDNQTARILMRRDKTLKICANHFIRPWMELKPNCGSEKAWVWKVQADYADQEPKSETLAIKFGNKENAQKWKSAFEKARQWVLECDAAKILAEENNKVEDEVKEESLEEKVDVKKEEKTDTKEDETLVLQIKEMAVKD